MPIHLSSRLMRCAELVTPGSVAADVGTDHGYLALYLLEKNICPKVFASDVREGPLDAARRSARQAGIDEGIVFLRSDGLDRLPLAEIGTVICAGMGGDTIMGILSRAPAVRSPKKRLILQPQSKIPELRKWLAAEGFSILRERLARDGKFLYTAMEVRFSRETRTLSPGQQMAPEWLADDPLLGDYLARVRAGAEASLAGLRRAKSPDETAIRYFEEAIGYLAEMEAAYVHGE